MFRIITIIIPHIITILILFLVGLFMPYLTRKEIVFGVRIPQGLRDHAEIERIKKVYTRNYLLSVGLPSLFFIILLVIRPDPIIILISIFVLIALLLGNYYLCHRSLKKIKADNQWTEGYKETSVMDIGYRPEKSLVSPWWFALPLGLIMLQIIIVLNHYDSIPEIMPIHYNFHGNPDNWAKKSYRLVLMSPAIEILVTAVLFLVYKMIGWSKQQLSVEDPEESKIRNQIFRRRWSGFIIFTSVIIILSFFSMQVSMLKLLDIGFQGMFIALAVISPMLIIVVACWLAFTTGQSGSRIKLDEKSESQNDKIDRDDDKHWILGIIYYNPDDPSLFVEHRFGVGWTINVGNRKAVLGFFGFLVLFSAALFLIMYFSRI